MAVLCTTMPTPVAGFDVQRELGRGGMGRVYLVRLDGGRRWGALKVIAPDDPPPRAVARFAREIAAVARIRHPNVVRLLGHGASARTPYALFEHIDGCDLARMSTPLPSPVAVHIGRQLAQAVAAVHRAGVVHRDIKPSNVMVSRACRVALIDFGLARLVDGDARDRGDRVSPEGGEGDLTGRGAVVGTPRYLAPEVRLGAAPSMASDVYALGLVLRQLLTGQPPALPGGRGPAGLVESGLPRRLELIVARCLAADPRRRPASAEEVCAALDGLAGNPAGIDVSPWPRLAGDRAGVGSMPSITDSTSRVVRVTRRGRGASSADILSDESSIGGRAVEVVTWMPARAVRWPDGTSTSRVALLDRTGSVPSSCDEDGHRRSVVAAGGCRALRRPWAGHGYIPSRCLHARGGGGGPPRAWPRRGGTMFAPTTIESVRKAHTLSELMAAGDAACAEKRGEVLSAVSRGLARCVAAPLQIELERVAATAAYDLRAACRSWDLVSAELRRRLASGTR